MKKFQIISILLIFACCTTPDTQSKNITSIINNIPLPEAKIVNFDIDSLSLRDITLLFDIEIKNPYPVKLKLSQMKSVFFIDKKQPRQANNSSH